MMQDRMLQQLTVAVLAAAMMGGGLWLNAGTASAQAGPKPVVETQQATVITAVVTAIDLSTRQVTLKGPNGSVTVHVSDQVKNLDQLKVGDKVGATYYESLVIEGRKASPGDKSAKAMSSSQSLDEQGQTGAMVGTQQTVTVVAKVVALDKPNGIITLKGPKGNVRTFKIKDASLLTHMTIGDDVVFKYTEAWAVAVAKV
jgi:Cu/Ag efflux protein CusF